MIPEYGLGKRNLTSHDKIMIAGGETMFWSVAGFMYPPLFLGIISNILIIGYHSIKLNFESKEVHPLKAARTL